MLGTTVILAFRAINRHKLRSFLTTLGIIIGVAAVVTMVTLGNGATAAVREQISSLGANVLQLRPGQGFGRGGGGLVGPPQGPARGASVPSASVCSEARCESVTIDIPPAAYDEVTCSTTRPLPRRAFQRGHSRPHGER